jgi:hypothetical protein
MIRPFGLSQMLRGVPVGSVIRQTLSALAGELIIIQISKDNESAAMKEVLCFITIIPPKTSVLDKKLEIVGRTRLDESY